MTQEEKAKAYDEVLEKAKSWHTDAQIDFKKSLETLFPELKESEDERIRGAIMHFISHTPTVPKGIINKEQMLAWLEKQGQRPQITWKPSDEQIKMLESLIENRSIERRHVVSLYEQLKKL